MTLVDNLYERVLWWVAWHLPRRLVALCYVRVVADVSTGVFSHKEMGTIGAQEAFAAWLAEYEPGELAEL